MLSILESQLRAVLEDLSNEQTLEFTAEDKKKAVEQFAAALDKQTTPREKEPRIRMSNVGRLPCQLQQEIQLKSPRERMPYNHWIRMMIGDCVEILVRLALEKTEVNVTSDGDDVKLDVSDTTIKGTSDIDIDGAVYDIKSCSQYAFRNKWSGGFQALYKADDFGYVGQLYGYADAQDKKAGGWIVVDKSSGEIKIVEVDASKEQEAFIRQHREHVVDLVSNNRPFQRCFEEEEETFFRKKTGGKILNKSCSWCSFKQTCWPEAEYLPSRHSKAQSKPYKWYIEYPDDPNTER